ncbi:hypothetical protein [Photobacterium aquae]|uniref:VapA family S-layer protein n=1 Tax=Photobacterium aquae TaxID=1195763 RepID=UPI00069D162F|nr:hypothetical protein [Photobacterium aquae]
MFKKSVVAAALTLGLGLAGSANAFDLPAAADHIKEQKVANQSTQAVLQFQIGQGDATFSVEKVREELGFANTAGTNYPVIDSVMVRLELTGGAKWNLDKVTEDKHIKQFITATTTAKGAAVATDITDFVFVGAPRLVADNVLMIPVKSLDPKAAAGQTWGDEKAGAVNRFNVDFAKTGVFDLRQATGSVRAKIGLQTTDGSFTGEPELTKVAFQMLDVFTVAVDENHISDNEAKVANQFKSFDREGKVFTTAPAFATIKNQTSDQPVNKEVLKLKLTGDFSDVTALNASSQTTAWSINAAKTEAYARVTSNLEAGATTVIALPSLKFSGKNPIPVMDYDFTAYMDSNATFNEFSRGAEGTYEITHDGFTFDTVTTGTTADNQIFIRDISGNLPKAGGSINVTVWEYDAKGNSTELVKGKALSVKLANKGAVTLTPAQIAKDLNIEVTPASQARFLFEVETEKGEAAVKKQVSGVGIDIQTGRNHFDTAATL